MDSYGYIETYGYTASVAAADEALKAADVILTNLYVISGGIVTVEFSGDVASVKIAVEVGSEFARKLGNYLSSNVIARVDSETKKILKKEERNKKEKISPLEEKSQEKVIRETDGTENDEADEIESIENTQPEVTIETEGIENGQSEVTVEIESIENAQAEVTAEAESVENTRLEVNIETEGIENTQPEVTTEAESVGNAQAEEILETETIEITAAEHKNTEEKEAVKKLRKKYQDMRVIELKTKVNKLKTEYTWNQIKGMTKKKLIEILIKYNQEE